MTVDLQLCDKAMAMNRQAAKQLGRSLSSFSSHFKAEICPSGKLLYNKHAIVLFMQKDWLHV
jgi:hypothetical protein